MRQHGVSGGDGVCSFGRYTSSRLMGSVRLETLLLRSPQKRSPGAFLPGIAGHGRFESGRLHTKKIKGYPLDIP